MATEGGDQANSEHGRVGLPWPGSPLLAYRAGTCRPLCHLIVIAACPTCLHAASRAKGPSNVVVSHLRISPGR